MKYVKPEEDKSGFHCPFCNVYAHQSWGPIGPLNLHKNLQYKNNVVVTMSDWKGAFCECCKEISLWYNGKLIYPENPNLPPPNEDLDVEIKKDYNEAANIVEKSPRAAAALLRLAIQKLCKQLGESGENINSDIGELVKKGLPVQIQQALDVVRVVGNESVHPGQIDLNDDKDVAYQLFELVNIIAQTMITQPKEISKLYSSLPKGKLDGIAKRDEK